jgi:hypothetical protein
MSPLTHLAEHFRIAEYNDSVLCTRESDVQPPRVIQKSDSLVFIAPDAAEDNVVFLATLKSIHGCHLYFLVKVLLQRTVVLHIVDDVRTLSLIRRHNANLARYNTRLEEFCDNFLDV